MFPIVRRFVFQEHHMCYILKPSNPRIRHPSGGIVTRSSTVQKCLSTSKIIKKIVVDVSLNKKKQIEGNQTGYHGQRLVSANLETHLSVVRQKEMFPSISKSPHNKINVLEWILQ